jgi:hypothetical protein
MRLANAFATAIEPAVLRNSRRLTLIISGHLTRTKPATATKAKLSYQ